MEEIMSGRVLITGCSKGIGLALAEEFSAKGWQVAATARNSDSSPLNSFSKAGVIVLRVDVNDVRSITEAAEHLKKVWGGVDVVVNNAAIFPGDGNERFEDLPLEWFAETFETNVSGVARVTSVFLPLLRKSTNPRIVNISSGAGSIGEKEDNAYYPYSVSKAALNMLTRALAAEFRGEKIIVTALSPGWVKTEMGGPHAEITAEESAGAIYKTITKLTMKQSGCFLGRDGSSEGYAW